MIIIIIIHIINFLLFKISNFFLMAKKSVLFQTSKYKSFRKLIYSFFEVIIDNISSLRISKYKKNEIYNLIKDFMIHYIALGKTPDKDFKKEITNFLSVNFRNSIELYKYYYIILKKFI